ncbi:hypothetical protein [Marininema halotolerans]|uniref:Uncharacterized protein n=1 Tax=Marininema halotolerans TaxID=1155944 RepID=A0A1I6NYV9_9BACL|nr:hypothetical protein [Marininema halotolerans]SFS33144.1 hypothetical protein SAMN05444972_101245 [Marininema halotolerans]
MIQLEYRLYDKIKSHPLLYTYENVDEEEVSARMVCDWFIKENQVFERMTVEMAPPRCIIYVRAAVEEEVINREVLTHPEWQGMRLEVRQFKETAMIYPLIETIHFTRTSSLRLYIQSDYVFLQDQKWEKTSAEIDENRRVFVLYVRPVG